MFAHNSVLDDAGLRAALAYIFGPVIPETERWDLASLASYHNAANISGPASFVRVSHASDVALPLRDFTLVIAYYMYMLGSLSFTHVPLIDRRALRAFAAEHPSCGFIDPLLTPCDSRYTKHIVSVSTAVSVSGSSTSADAAALTAAAALAELPPPALLCRNPDVSVLALSAPASGLRAMAGSSASGSSASGSASFTATATGLLPLCAPPGSALSRAHAASAVAAVRSLGPQLPHKSTSAAALASASAAVAAAAAGAGAGFVTGADLAAALTALAHVHDDATARRIEHAHAHSQNTTEGDRGHKSHNSRNITEVTDVAAVAARVQGASLARAMQDRHARAGLAMSTGYFGAGAGTRAVTGYSSAVTGLSGFEGDALVTVSEMQGALEAQNNVTWR